MSMKLTDELDRAIAMVDEVEDDEVGKPGGAEKDSAFNVRERLHGPSMLLFEEARSDITEMAILGEKHDFVAIWCHSYLRERKDAVLCSSSYPSLYPS